MTLDQFLSRFDHVRPQGRNKWSARCPAHEDRSHDTLSLAVGSSGRRLAYCWAGCDTESVLDAVGLHFPDMFAEPQHWFLDRQPNGNRWRDGAPRPARPPRPLTYAEMVINAVRVQEERRSRLYGRWHGYWISSDLIGQERDLAATLRRWACRLDPEASSTWRLLEWAIHLEQEAVVREVDLEAEMLWQRQAFRDARA